MPDTKNKPQIGYIVQERNGRFEVCVASGRTVMVCEEEGSASHYSSLLNEAHKAGYKLGYRDGRNK
jgi:hypothetical protein